MVWDKISPVARDPFNILSESPGKVHARELAGKLGLGNEFVVAGTLAWPGRYAYEVRRKLPV